MKRIAQITGILCAALVGLAIAQEGHPLSGTWHGSWTQKGKQNRVVLYMKWDGKSITGNINPGPNAIPIKSVTLDPKDWGVHIDADSKSGPIKADGKIEDIGSYNRTITGTWTQGGATGELKLRRD